MEGDSDLDNAAMSQVWDVYLSHLRILQVSYIPKYRNKDCHGVLWIIYLLPLITNTFLNNGKSSKWKFCGFKKIRARGGGKRILPAGAK